MFASRTSDTARALGDYDTGDNSSIGGTPTGWSDPDTLISGLNKGKGAGNVQGMRRGHTHHSHKGVAAWRRFEVLGGVIPIFTATTRLCILGATLWSLVPFPAVTGLLAVQGLLVMLSSGYAVVGARDTAKLAVTVVLSLLAATMNVLVSWGLITFGGKLLSEPDGTLNTYLAWIYHIFVGTAVVGAVEVLCQLLAPILLLCGLPQRERVCRCCRCRGGGGGSGHSGGAYGGDKDDSRTVRSFSDVLYAGGDDDPGLGIGQFDSGGRSYTSAPFIDLEVPGAKKGEHHHHHRGSHRHHLHKPHHMTKNARCATVCVVCILCLLFGFVVTMGVIAWTTATSAQPSDAPGASPMADGSVPAECDPLVLAQCLLPYPSNFHTVQDTTTATGIRVRHGATALPQTRWGPVDPTYFNEADGFSPVAPLVFTFDSEASIDNVATYERIGQSLWRNSTTVLLDQGGKVIAHFVDRDAYDQTFGPAHVPLLVLQPAESLQHNTTYVVGVRGLLSEADGSTPLQPSPAFKDVRDNPQAPAGDKPASRVSDARRARFNSFVFPLLQAAGFPRGELQLAWEFTTMSQTNALGRARHMIEDAIDAVGADGPAYEIDSTEEVPCPAHPTADDTTIGRTVWGHATLPSYLQRPGPGPGSFLTRGEASSAGTDGIRPLPVRNGDARVDFMLRIPCSLLEPADGAAVAPAEHILQYGHGLFGSRAEAKGLYLSGMANRYKWVIIASDWTGMSRYDVLSALRLFLVRADEFASLPERTLQGFVNKRLMLRLLKGKLASDPVLQSRSNGPGGKPIALVSASTPAGYYGNSQGSVVGGGYYASNPDLTKGVLGVPGCPFALLLSRSKDFVAYYDIMKLQMWSERDIRIVLSVIQQVWDPAESGGWLRTIRENPDKRVLMQAAMGDAQVTTVAGHFMARSLATSTVRHQTRPVWGLVERASPLQDGNAYVEFHYLDVPPIPHTDTPPPAAYDTHECPRRERRGQDQIHDFMMTGEIVQHCSGEAGCISHYCPSGTSKN